jgi:hypothetical protein
MRISELCAGRTPVNFFSANRGARASYDAAAKALEVGFHTRRPVSAQICLKPL